MASALVPERPLLPRTAEPRRFAQVPGIPQAQSKLARWHSFQRWRAYQATRALTPPGVRPPGKNVTRPRYSTRWHRHQSLPSSSTRPSPGSAAPDTSMQTLRARNARGGCSRLQPAQGGCCRPSPMPSGPFLHSPAEPPRFRVRRTVGHCASVSAPDPPGLSALYAGVLRMAGGNWDD